MIFNWLPWVLSAVGAVGVGGVIALFIFAPAVATMLMQGVSKLLGAMLQTRLGVGILVGGACLFGGFVYGDQEAVKRCHAAEARAEAAAAKRDSDIQRDLAKDAQTKAAELEKQNSTLTQQVTDYEISIAKLGTAKSSCRAVNDDDLRRLRNIR